MKIFDHFQHINLTTDQRNALEKLQAFIESDERVFILQGYAGSGKTTLMKGFVDYLNSLSRKYQLMAPTGRAAKVINQKTGFESTTIHRGIYSLTDVKEITNSDQENDISFLYQFQIARNPERYDSILIVDEASMVSDIISQKEFFQFGSGKLLNDLMIYSGILDNSAKSKLIFIGDPAQLPPVGMPFSPALDPEYLKDTYKISVSRTELKQVKRQDENNGILIAATKIRQCLTSGYFNEFNLRKNDLDILNPSFQDFIEVYKKQLEQKIIICYKNKTALDLNRDIRVDRFGHDIPIQATDKVIIGANNYKLGIMNGEFAIVSESSSSIETREVRFFGNGGKTICVNLTWRKVSLVFQDESNLSKNVTGYILENYLYGDNKLKPEEHRALYIDFKNRHPKIKKGTREFKDMLFNDMYLNCILLKYGYAVTCHKAQGGEWENAFVYWDRSNPEKNNNNESKQNPKGKTNSDFYRWAYTAITRASKKLFCINPPYFSSFSSLSFIDFDVQKAYNEMIGQPNSTFEINFEEVLPQLERIGLIDAPLPVQDHFIHRWYNLEKQFIDIKDCQIVGNEVRYVFTRDGKTAAVKHWINNQYNFNTKFQKLPAQTNSDEFFEIVTKIIENATPIEITRNGVNGVLSKIEFDVSIEEEKPFLKNLFDAINSGLSIDERITEIEHLQYKERYTIEKRSKFCVIDFEYDGAGFFGRVMPLKNKCNSTELLTKIKSIVTNLKEADHVI